MKYHNYWIEKPPEDIFCLFVSQMPLIKGDGKTTNVRIRFGLGKFLNGKLYDWIGRKCLDPYEYNHWISLEELDDVLMEKGM